MSDDFKKSKVQQSSGVISEAQVSLFCTFLILVINFESKKNQVQGNVIITYSSISQKEHEDIWKQKLKPLQF